MRPILAAIALLLTMPSHAAAQDLLRDFERFVEDVLPDRDAPPASGAVSAPARPVPPAVPTPETERPDTATTGEADEPPLPRPRPEAAEDANASGEAIGEEGADALAESGATTAASPAEPQPDRVYQTACPALLGGQVVGEMLEPIADGICSERSPLSVTGLRVNGRDIALSSPASTNCAMAGAFADWVGEVDLYAQAAMDAPIEMVNTGTSFICRNRYSAEDGFVSEHGFANALDITGFTLADGTTIAVEADWLPASAPPGKLLRQAHGAACGRFTTVLGPEANADHEDHLHLDLGCHGATCTAQICE